MSQRKRFNLAESVLKHCQELIAQEIYGEAPGVTKKQKLAFSDNNIQRRCSLLTASRKKNVPTDPTDSKLNSNLFICSKQKEYQ